MSKDVFWPNPITDFTFFVAPKYRQGGSYALCGKLEGKFLDCLEAYGVIKAREKCAELLYDLVECDTHIFQKKRTAAIQNERMKQYREGKLSKPFEEHPYLESFLYL